MDVTDRTPALGDDADPTESTRRSMIETGQPRADLAANKGQTWTTEQLTADFEVIGFLAPYVIARRRADGVLGQLEFSGRPRVYFSFVPA